jgi:hypothetical protein
MMPCTLFKRAILSSLAISCRNGIRTYSKKEVNMKAAIGALLLVTLALAGCANQGTVRTHGTGRYEGHDSVKSGVIQVPGYTLDNRK